MTSAGQNLPQPGHFKVRTFLEVPADTPSAAVGGFIDKVNRLGLWNFFYFVEDDSGQIWIVNPSEPEPLCMRLEDWHAAQTQMGLGAPVDQDDGDEGDDVDEAPRDPPKPPARATTAAPATGSGQRPTRTQAAAPTTPSESRPIPTDPREAIRARTAQRRQGI